MLPKYFEIIQKIDCLIFYFPIIDRSPCKCQEIDVFSTTNNTTKFTVMMGKYRFFRFDPNGAPIYKHTVFRHLFLRRHQGDKHLPWVVSLT